MYKLYMIIGGCITIWILLLIDLIDSHSQDQKVSYNFWIVLSLIFTTIVTLGLLLFFIGLLY